MTDFGLLEIVAENTDRSKVYNLTTLGSKVLHHYRDDIEALMAHIAQYGRNKYYKASRKKFVSVIWSDLE